MRKSFVTIFFILIVDVVLAQNESFISRFDSAMSRRYYQKDIDTLYIKRPKERFRVTTNVNLSNNTVYWENDAQKADFSAKEQMKLSINVGYRGIAFGYSFRPKGKSLDSDQEFNLRFYTRSIGGEFSTQVIENFEGELTIQDSVRTIKSKFMQQKQVGANLYYVKNNRKFSYPAAFTFSYNQLKSAGSLLFGCSFIGSYLDIYSYDASLKSYTFAVGAGYGRNFVIKRNFFIHISAIPMLSIFQHHITEDPENGKQVFPFQIFDFIITARTAIIYNYKRFYTGGNVVYTNYGITNDNTYISFNRSLLRYFVGVRF